VTLCNKGGEKMDETKVENNDEKAEQPNEVKVDVNLDTKEMIEAMNKINSSIRHMNDTIESVEVDNSINLDRSNINSKLVDANNNKLTDYELCKRVLHNIDNAKNQHVKIHPEFVEFMRQFVAHVDAGGSATEFKNNNIFRQFDLSKISI
jgi:vacuolar-type H+-ATPase subunit I/STV1